MKISELPHIDPLWGYLELKDGSLVALPKQAIKELQAENEQLKKDLEHARSFKNVMKTENQKLKSENEKLKVENVKQLRGSLMNLRFGYAYAMRRLFSGTNTDKYEFWKKLQTKFRSDCEAYRKKALMEGK